jgi:hypothetical protein
MARHHWWAVAVIAVAVFAGLCWLLLSRSPVT